MKATLVLAAFVAAGLLWGPIATSHGALIPWDDSTMNVSVSSQLGSYTPDNTVNLSGLNAGGTHSFDGNHMWMGINGDVAGAWIEYDLGQVFSLTKARLWAYNRGGYTSRSMQQADVLVSTDGSTWTPVATDTTFPRSPGNSSYGGFGFEFSPTGTDVRYVRIEADTNYGADSGDYTGLSEIRFFDTADVGPEALLLDIGQASMSYRGTESPAHTTGAVTGDHWSNVGYDTAAGSLQSMEGYLAADVSVDFGAETGDGTNVIDWDGAFKRVNGANSGIYGTDLMADSIARDGSGARAVAAKITGLEPGNYELFVMARNPFDGGPDDQEIFVGAIADPGEATTDFSGLLSELIDDNTAATWIEGANYVQIPFSLADGEALVVVADRVGGSGVGILSGIAIVGPTAIIPEPGTIVLLALGGLCLIAFRLPRRRKR